MADEIELKLELTADGAVTLGDSALLSGTSIGDRQRSIYFDTGDKGLAGAGLSLRIRRTGRTRIQTVKAAGRSMTGLFERREWERKVTSDVPVLDDSSPVRALLGARIDELAPVFEVHVERRTWNFDREGAAIEVALDRGEVVSGDRQSPVCEVELELKDGPPAGLFALAREIGALVPAPLGVLSKAERGYRLLGPADVAAKAEPIQLDKAMTAAMAFGLIAHACLRHYRLNETILLDRRDPEALHQARVALRRLRTAFSIHKRMLADQRFYHLGTEARWLAGELGEARNLDVLIARTEPGSLRDGLELAHAAAYCRVETALPSPRARTFLLDLSEWLVAGDWLKRPSSSKIRDRPAKVFATDALDRFRKHVKKRGRDLIELDAAARHALRKAAKKLRYAAEFFVLLYDDVGEKRRRKRFIGPLKTLQDKLGALNDLVVAARMLDQLGLAAEPGAATLLRGGRKRTLRAASKAYDSLVDAQPFW